MITFQPKPGSVAYCDYRGFIEPEMVKKRPIIVISKHNHNAKLLLVVPISSVEPRNKFEYHIEMDPRFCQLHLSGMRSWVKCDMLNVISLGRLDLMRDKQSGQQYIPDIGRELLKSINGSILLAYK